MRNAKLTLGLLVSGVLLVSAGSGDAQDWPQWRGPNRDNRVTSFVAPAMWPKSLTKQWKVTVGLGEASPVLVGDKVYAFGRLGTDETVSCLDASTGKVAWQKKYSSAKAIMNGAKGHPGPRSTPAVAEGKVCTLGVWGEVYCFDAATGNVVWHKDTNTHPEFFTASSPIILDGKCIAFTGNRGSGEVAAYDLANGEAKWKWTGPGPSYGSFALMTVDGVKQVVTPTERSIAGVSVADGKLLWEYSFAPRYNNCTPIVDGSTVIVTSSDRGMAALKIEKQGDKFEPKELWKKTQGTHNYNTPVLKDGLLFGMTTGRNFICIDAQTGAMLWTDTTARGQCGEILDAGSVLLALTSDTNLIAFKPSKTGYEELAKYKVANSETWAYPAVSGKRIFVKDLDSVTLWTLD